MQRIIAGGVVFFALVILADFDSTAQIAVAFAYLILLSALMTVGPVAFARISTLVGSPSGPIPTTHPVNANGPGK